MRRVLMHRVQVLRPGRVKILALGKLRVVSITTIKGADSCIAVVVVCVLPQLCEKEPKNASLGAR